jgi:hypothetical protein
MLFKGNLSDILAAIALAVSLILAGIEIKRRLSRLHLKFTGITVICRQTNTLYLLLHLTIMNTSSITRTIYRIHFQPQGNYQISEVTGVQDFSQSLVTFQPLGSSGRGIQVRLDDIALFPLDVEPLHSKSCFLAIALSPISVAQLAESPRPSLGTVGYLLAFDYRQRKIAKLPLTLK